VFCFGEQKHADTFVKEFGGGCISLSHEILMTPAHEEKFIFPLAFLPVVLRTSFQSRRCLPYAENI
jgi:hypothetical protein